jgi:hypothetical protein
MVTVSAICNLPLHLSLLSFIDEKMSSRRKEHTLKGISIKHHELSSLVSLFYFNKTTNDDSEEKEGKATGLTGIKDSDGEEEDGHQERADHLFSPLAELIFLSRLSTDVINLSLDNEESRIHSFCTSSTFLSFHCFCFIIKGRENKLGVK